VTSEVRTDVIAARWYALHQVYFWFALFIKENKSNSGVYARVFSLSQRCLCWRSLLYIPFDWRLRTRHFEANAAVVAHALEIVPDRGPICCSALSKWIRWRKFNALLERALA